MEMRQGLGRPVVMTCRVLRAHPSRVLRFEWLLSNRLLHAGAFDAQRDETEYTIRSLNRDGWGEYTCNVINEAGAGKCTFQVTGKDYFVSRVFEALPVNFLLLFMQCTYQSLKGELNRLNNVALSLCETLQALL